MAVLELLKITVASPKKDTSPTGRFRRRMIEAINLQIDIDIANADATGQAFTRTRQKWIKDGAVGEKNFATFQSPCVVGGGMTRGASRTCR